MKFIKVPNLPIYIREDGNYFILRRSLLGSPFRYVYVVYDFKFKELLSFGTLKLAKEWYEDGIF